MNEFVSALQDIERELSRKQGPFTLFAVFEREENPNRWDLVIAAAWVGEDKVQAMKLVADELKKRLAPTEIVCISRVVFLDPDEPSVRAITSEHPVEHGRILIASGSIYGWPADHGYVITARAAA